jgi:hypothetical protein
LVTTCTTVTTAATCWLSDVSRSGNPSFYSSERKYVFGPQVDFGAAQLFFNANAAGFELSDGDTIAESFGVDYEITEKVYAGYLMSQINSTPEPTIIGGVRVERTEAVRAHRQSRAILRAPRPRPAAGLFLSRPISRGGRRRPASDPYVDDHGQPDCKASYDIGDKFTVYLQARYVTDEPLRFFSGNNRRLAENEIYSWNAMSGVQMGS